MFEILPRPDWRIPPKVSSNCRERHSVLVDESDHLILIQHQRLFRFECEHRDPTGGADLDSMQSNARNVESHVMSFLGHLDRYSAAVPSRQLTSSCKTLVRSLETLHCQNGAPLDYHGLPDFKPRHLLGNSESECDVFLLFRRKLQPGTKSPARHQRTKPGGSLDQFDAFLLQLVGERAKDGMRVLLLESQQNSHGTQIRPNIEQTLGCDLTEHHALSHAALGESRNQLGKLSDLQPNNLIHKT